MRNALLPAGLVLVLFSQSVIAQTTRPADRGGVSLREPYNPWTSHRLTGDGGGVRSGLEDIGVKPSLSYQHQFQQNMRGGLDTHNAHRQTGSYDLKLELDFGKMGLMDDSGFFIENKGNWSESDYVGISANKVGASEVALVNSDACDDQPIYVNKWWLWYRFLEDRIELRLGLIETNKDIYDVSPYANHEDKDFINRLSIRNATIPHRTGIGAFLKFEPVDGIYFQTAAVDAQSRHRRTGFDTAFHDEAWFIGLWEFGFTPEWDSPKGLMPGRYRIGFWFDPRPRTVFQRLRDDRVPASVRGDNMGLYLGLDQMIWKENQEPRDRQGLGFFGRYGHARRDVSPVSDYWSAGLSYTGPIPTRDQDVLAFCVSQAILSNLHRSRVNTLADRETVYECYYKFHLTPWCILSPDIQIVTNPGGDKDDRDSIIGGIRIRIIF